MLTALLFRIILRLKGVYVHGSSEVKTLRIGRGTKIWQNTVIMGGSVIGANCNLGAGVFIETGVRVGERVTIKNNCAVWNQVSILDDVFIGPGVVFTNARHPKPGRDVSELQSITVREGAIIGAGAVVLSDVTIGKGSVVGAGSVVTRSVPNAETWFGNPARPS